MKRLISVCFVALFFSAFCQMSDMQAKKNDAFAGAMVGAIGPNVSSEPVRKMRIVIKAGDVKLLRITVKE